MPAHSIVASFAGTRLGLNPSVQVGGVPTCRLTSAVSDCGVSIDRTALVPCVSLSDTIWASCQKPTMRNFFPRYSALDPTDGGVTFNYPTNLYRNVPQPVTGSPTGSPGGSVPPNAISPEEIDTMLERPGVWWSGATWDQQVPLSPALPWLLPC